MKLFRVTLTSKNNWDNKKRTLYVTARDKNEAIEIINKNKRENFIISKIYYLGYELSSVLYQAGED